MKTLNKTLILAIIGSVSATAVIADPKMHLSKEGSGGVRGGGGTEIDFLSQVPDETDYRAVFRWPTTLIPNLKLPGNRYAHELQVRKVFRKAELAQPNRGWSYEFYARPQRRQGDWTRINAVDLVTTLNLIHWFREKTISQETLKDIQQNLQKGTRYFLAPGGQMFTVEFDPVNKDGRWYPNRWFAARLVPYNHEALGDWAWGLSVAPESVDYLINDKEVTAEELEKLDQFLTDTALRMAVYEQPETASPLVIWARMSKDMDLKNPVGGFFNGLRLKVGRQAEALVHRGLDVVTPDGTCNSNEFDRVEQDVKSWQLASDDYYSDLGKTGIGLFYSISGFQNENVVPLKSLVNTALSLVRSYCVSDSNAESQTDRALLFEQIQAQKAQFKLGDFVKEQ